METVCRKKIDGGNFICMKLLQVKMPLPAAPMFAGYFHLMCVICGMWIEFKWVHVRPRGPDEVATIKMVATEQGVHSAIREEWEEYYCPICAQDFCHLHKLTRVDKREPSEM